MKSIYDFSSYKDYLIDKGHSERGLLTKLADAAECQKSYLSACLNGKSQLTLDHALGIAELIGLDDNEQDYFFLLIEKEKASTIKLRRKLDSKLKNLSREAYRLKNQQKDTHVISTESDTGLGLYYSSWIPTALHMLTSVRELQTAPQLAQRLNISKELTTVFLNQLQTLDFVKKEGSNYKWSSGNLHLADNSAWISNHHMNWRLRAVDNVQKNDASATHYTAIQSMSEADFEALKKKIAHFIKEFNRISDPSTPEEAFAINIDFFKI